MTTKIATKTITFEKAMKLFKKYVSKSATRPVLQYVYFDPQGYLVATDSHTLLRINTDYITDIPSDYTPNSLFCPKEMKLVEESYNYPDTSRLMPIDFNSTVKLDNSSLKELTDQVKASKKLLTKKQGHVALNLTTKSTDIITNELIETKLGKKVVERTFETINTETINSLWVDGEEMKVSLNTNYLLNALDVTKKLSSLSNDPTSIKLVSSMRPFVFTQSDIFDVLVLPIRTY